MTNVGRPREFRNAAEKQKAYRERKKASDQQQNVMSEMLTWFEEQESALRNFVDYWKRKGKSVEIASAGLSLNFGKVLVDGYNHRTIESALWKYLLLTGALIPGAKRYEQFYELSSVQVKE